MSISFVHRGQVIGCRARAIMGWCEMHDVCCEGGVYGVHGGLTFNHQRASPGRCDMAFQEIQDSALVDRDKKTEMY
jgi:hypothetical protein